MLPVQVTSKEGPVRGLVASDFQLFVDGRSIFDRMLVRIVNNSGEVLKQCEATSQILADGLQLLNFNLGLSKIKETEVALSVECLMRDRQQIIATKRLKIAGN